MNGVISTNEYMRSRLRKFTKEELIDGILSLQFTTIDLIVQRCEHKRVLKECEEDEKKEQQFAAEREELRKTVAEYNLLAKKARENGLTALSIDEVDHMRALLAKIDRIQNRWAGKK